MPDVEDELHATIDEIIEDVDQLKAVELEKRRRSPADARAPELAQQVVEMAAELVPKTVKERKLAERAAKN